MSKQQLKGLFFQLLAISLVMFFATIAKNKKHAELRSPAVSSEK